MQVSPPAVKLQNTLMASPVQPWFGSIQYSPGRRKQVRNTAAEVEWGRLWPSRYWMLRKSFVLANYFSWQLEWNETPVWTNIWWFKVTRILKMLLSWNGIRNSRWCYFFQNSIAIPEESLFFLYEHLTSRLVTSFRWLIYVHKQTLCRIIDVQVPTQNVKSSAFF